MEPVQVPIDPPRFDLDHGRGYMPAASMEQCEYGEWVRYEAYVADVSALRLERDNYKEKYREIVERCRLDMERPCYCGVHKSQVQSKRETGSGIIAALEGVEPSEQGSAEATQ